MAEKTPTPHIEAKYGEIAETVIMSGDPLRAKFMAEHFLENPVQFNNVRGMLGFTGSYKGKRVSVMGHGMGIPSMAIYSYELFNFYGVKNIIRVGSAGSMNADLHIGDLMMAQGACTNSNYASQFLLSGMYAPIADFGLLRAAVEKAEELGYRYKVGNVFSSDVFYGENKEHWKEMRTKYNCMCVEMESFALFANAKALGKKAACLLTISDSFVASEITTAEERQTSFHNMMKIALELAGK